jgi:hydrogenase maturation protease
MLPQDEGRCALLIACGNVLRGDDGVGWRIAAAARALVPRRRLQIIRCHQCMPELADAVGNATAVVFVDAACDIMPGTVEVRPLPAGADCGGGLTRHQFGPADLLRLASLVHGRAPRQAWLVTVGAETFALGEGLSPAVAAAVEPACAAALRALHLTADCAGQVP